MEDITRGRRRLLESNNSHRITSYLTYMLTVYAHRIWYGNYCIFFQCFYVILSDLFYNANYINNPLYDNIIHPSINKEYHLIEMVAYYIYDNKYMF